MSALILSLIAGAVVGVALGALGGGGSILAVPALIYLLGFSPASATTASLLIVTATSATALYAHARAGNVRWKAGTLFAAAGVLPAAAAGAAAARLPQQALTAAFAAVAALAAVRMLRPGGTADQAEHAERPVKAAGAGAGLGALTGLLGVGGGFLAVPALVTVLGLEMQAAVGTSLLVISTNSLASLVTRGSATAGGLDWAVVGPFIATAILGAWDGRRLAAKISGTALQRTFAVVLLALAALMLIDVLT
ncbi:sulfite exporter TauE/SafE family protein [Streptomyces thermolilacinus]